MPFQLLQTKLYIPPPHPNLVHRPRLIRRLEEGLSPGHRLALVSAPAGFGKTTLLTEWIPDCGRLEPKVRFAWLSLDEGDRALGDQVARHARIYVWPLEKRPQTADGKHGSLHAKIALADGREMLISSANLTEYAMTLNMEMGLLVHWGPLPGQVEAHLVRLVEQGVFQAGGVSGGVILDKIDLSSAHLRICPFSKWERGSL